MRTLSSAETNLTIASPIPIAKTNRLVTSMYRTPTHASLALVETVASCGWRPRFYSGSSLFPVIWPIVFDVQTLRSFFFTSDARQRNRGVGRRAFFQGLI